MITIQMLSESEKHKIQERFRARIRLANNCWIWPTLNQVTGYPQAFNIPGFKLLAAHRASYLLFCGELSDGYHIDHLCRNKACVNPKHLEQVTRAENLKRARFGGNWQHVKTHCPQGHEYTIVRETVYGKERMRRICKTCIKIRQLKKNNPFLISDPERVLSNIQHFFDSITKNTSMTNNVPELMKLVQKYEKMYGVYNFKSAVKLLLFMRGIVVYGKDVVRSVKTLERMESSGMFTIFDLAQFYNLTITKTRTNEPVDIFKKA